MLEEVRSIYKKVNFIDRYKALSASYSIQSNIVTVKKEEILDILFKYGYVKSKYVNKDKYFEIENYERNEIKEHICVGLNIIIRYSEVDFVLSIVINDQRSNGGTYSSICNKLGEKNIIRRPEFTNQEDLKKIILNGLHLYEEIKKELFKIDV